MRLGTHAQDALHMVSTHQSIATDKLIGMPHCTVRATLARLYDPTTMPANLTKAHAALDKAVDAAYKPDGGASSYANDGERVAFLFKRYAALTSLV